MQVLTDDGTRMEMRVDGRDRANSVVVIHGFPLTHEIWDTQVEALSRTHRMIAPDLRGAGSSSVSDGPYLMEMLAADVAAALDALSVDRATIVGHSMGGYVALAFARMFTERVERLVLVSSRLAADTPQQAQERRKLADGVERADSIGAVVDAYLPRLLAAGAFADRPALVERVRTIAQHTNPLGVAATLRGMALRAPGDDIAEDLGVPMLMIAGAKDATISLEEAGAVARRFPRGRLVVCEQSGHLPMMEEPDVVTAALAAVLNE